MRLARLRQIATIAWGLQGFIKNPVTPKQARENIKRRMEKREELFLASVKKLIYENKQSPYRKLLLHAGCEYSDLEGSVKIRGIEDTLVLLRDEGVYITFDELKGKTPVFRRGLTIETQQEDFDNPFLMGKSIYGKTSGSSSRVTRVAYDWRFLEEEAQDELLSYEAHGLVDSPVALWLPGLPSISGIHNLLLHIKFQKPPEKWFSHIKSPGIFNRILHKVAIEYLVWSCRILGLSIPRPQITEIDSALRVAKWMEDRKRKCSRGTVVLRTFTSSAVYVVQKALEEGLDLGGCVISTGGEPLTEARYRFIKRSGVNVICRYASTEAGMMGTSCLYNDHPDDIHLYMDRLAVIPKNFKTKEQQVDSFLFTSLSTNAGKVLLNTELGDIGNLYKRECNCLFGSLGMNVHLSNIRSNYKLTEEGISVLTSDLYEIVGEIVERAGGSPNDYQIWKTQDESGVGRITIAINPDIPSISEREVVNTVLEKLKEREVSTRIASLFWEQAHTIQVVRDYPKVTEGQKLPYAIDKPY